MEQNPYPGLEIRSNLKRQEREWFLQRIVWMLLYALLAGIMFGLIGNGPMSETSMQVPGSGYRMEYQRFMRHRTPDRLHLLIPSSSDSARFELAREYAKHVEIEKVIPTPEKMISTADSIIFIFNANSSSEVHASLYVRPEKIGKIAGWVAFDNQPRQSFSQFVYP